MERIRKYQDSPSTRYRVRCHSSGERMKKYPDSLSNSPDACGTEGVSRKKKLSIQKCPDTSARCLILYLNFYTYLFCFYCKGTKHYSSRGEKLNYNSCTSLLLRKLQNLLFWLLKSSGHQSVPCLFDSRFL